MLVTFLLQICTMSFVASAEPVFPEYEYMGYLAGNNYRENMVYEPYDVLVNDGLIYIANTKNASILVLNESDNSYYGEISKRLGDYLLLEPRRLAVFGDNLYVADMGADCVKIFNKKTFAYVGSIKDDDFDGVESVAVTDDYIFVNDRFNYEIKVYDADNYEYVSSFGWFSDVHSIQVHDNKLYVADYRGSYVYVYDTDTLEELETLDLGGVIAMAFNGTTMYAVCNYYKEYIVFDLSTYDYEIKELDVESSFFGVAYSNGKLFLADRWTSRVYKLNLSNGKFNIITESSLIEPYCLTVDENYLYVASTKNHSVIIYDKATLERVNAITEIEGYGKIGEIRGISLFGNNLYLSDFSKNTVIIVDKATFELVDTIWDYFNGVEAAIATEDYIFVADRFNYEIDIYDAENYSHVYTIGFHYLYNFDVHDIAVHDGVLYIADFRDGGIYAYSADTFEQLDYYYTYYGPLSLTADDNYLYYGTVYGYVGIIDLDTGEETGFTTDTERIFGVVLDGDTMYLADRINSRIVSYVKGTSGYEFSYSFPLVGAYSFDDPFGIASYNGLLYIANSDENEVDIFDMNTHELVGKIMTNLGDCIGLAISNGKLYVANNNAYYDDDNDEWIVPPIAIFDLSDNSYIGYIDHVDTMWLDDMFGVTASGGKLYLTYRWCHAVYVLDENDYSLIGTIGTPFERGDDQTHLNNPSSVTVHDGLVYVLDRYNEKIKIYDEETLDYVTSVYDDEHPMYRPFSCTIYNGIIYVCDTKNAEIKAFDAETHDYIGTFLDSTDFDNPRFIYFIGGQLFVVDGDDNQYVHIYCKSGTAAPAPDPYENDITDEIAGSYTASGIPVDGAVVGESGDLVITLNDSNATLISGAVRWVPATVGGAPFTEDSGEYTASLTFNVAGEHDVVIMWQKQVYINSFVGWQTTDIFGVSAIPVTVSAGTNALAELIETAVQTESDAVYGDKGGNYPPEQEAMLTSAIEAAQAVADKTYVPSAEYDDAIAALQAALDAFNESRIPDTDALADIIEQAERIQKGNYTDESWNALQKAISEAKALLSKESVMQAELDMAAKAINDAINALAPGVPDTGDGIALAIVIVLAALSSLVLLASAKRKKAGL